MTKRSDPRPHLDPPLISPPPSLREILDSDDDRVGRVDFSTALGGSAEVPGSDEPDTSGGPDGPGDGPEPESPDLGTNEPETPQAETSQAETPAETSQAETSQAETSGPPPPPLPVPPRLLRSVGLLDQADPPVSEARETDDPGATHRSGPAAGGGGPTVGGLGAPEEQLRHLALSVDAVAASVIARMREAGEANRRHLEALEAEAARRCELLTAQAELDAELIRLHARREAYAIITAARMRSGEEGSASEQARELDEVGESFARFTEAFEGRIDDWTDPDDHPGLR